LTPAAPADNGTRRNTQGALDQRVLRPRHRRMRAGGHLIQDEVLAHLWPTHHENVNFFGSPAASVGHFREAPKMHEALRSTTGHPLNINGSDLAVMMTASLG